MSSLDAADASCQVQHVGFPGVVTREPVRSFQSRVLITGRSVEGIHGVKK